MAYKKAGALWLKEGKNGKFFSGVFEPEGKGGIKYQISVFKNDHKEKPNQPDYVINMKTEGDESDSY